MVKSRNSDISYRTVTSTVTLILQIRHVFSQFLLIPIGGYARRSSALAVARRTACARIADGRPMRRATIINPNPNP